MAGWFNRGKFRVLNSDTVLTSATGTGQIDCMLIRDSYVFDDIDNFVVDISAHEVTGGSYVRQQIDNPSVTESDVTGSGRAFFDGNDVVFSSVPSQGTGILINAVVPFENIAGGDTVDPLLFYNDFTAIAGNGSDITVQWNASGIADIT